MNIPRTIATLLAVALYGASIAQSDIHIRAAEVVDRLDVPRSELKPNELALTINGRSKILRSGDMRFSFYGDDNRLVSFRWTRRYDDVRSRGEYRGSHLKTPKEAQQRAQAVFSRFESDEGWKIKRVIDAGTESLGGLQEYAGGAVSVEFEYFVNGLQDMFKGAVLTFDSSDGNAIGMSLMSRPTQYAPATGVITPMQAVSRAREHVTAYLRAVTPGERSEKLISEFPAPTEASARLAYSEMNSEFGSVVSKYANGGAMRYPIYVVDLKSLIVYIMASTGECVGGLAGTSASGVTATGPPENTPAAISAPVGTSGDKVTGEPPEAFQVDTATLIIVVAVVLAVGSALLFRFAKRGARH